MYCTQEVGPFEIFLFRQLRSPSRINELVEENMWISTCVKYLFVGYGFLVVDRPGSN